MNQAPGGPAIQTAAKVCCGGRIDCKADVEIIRREALYREDAFCDCTGDETCEVEGCTGSRRKAGMEPERPAADAGKHDDRSCHFDRACQQIFTLGRVRREVKTLKSHIAREDVKLKGQTEELLHLIDTMTAEVVEFYLNEWEA